MQRGVDLDVRNDRDFVPLGLAIGACNMPAVRFLLDQYRARGRKEQDVLRELIERPPLDKSGDTNPLIHGVIRQNVDPIARRAMVKLLVQEARADIWAEKSQKMVMKRNNTRTYACTFMPVHAAAHVGLQPVIDFFLTECGMPVDTRTSDMKFTVLQWLTMSGRWSSCPW